MAILSRVRTRHTCSLSRLLVPHVTSTYPFRRIIPQWIKSGSHVSTEYGCKHSAAYRSQNGSLIIYLQAFSSVASLTGPTGPLFNKAGSHAGRQGSYLRSLDHLGRTTEARRRKNTKKIKCDGLTAFWLVEWGKLKGHTWLLTRGAMRIGKRLRLPGRE